MTSSLWRRLFPPLPPSFTSLHRCRHGCGGADVRLAIHLSQHVASESEIQPTTAGHIAFIFFNTSDVQAARGDTLVHLLSFLSIKPVEKTKFHHRAFHCNMTAMVCTNHARSQFHCHKSQIYSENPRTVFFQHGPAAPGVG